MVPFGTCERALYLIGVPLTVDTQHVHDQPPFLGEVYRTYDCCFIGRYRFILCYSDIHGINIQIPGMVYTQSNEFPKMNNYKPPPSPPCLF